MSSSPAQIPLGLAGEPPLSPPAEEGVELHAAPAPPPAAPLRPPLEAELVQQGKLSMGQLAQAHRDRLEKGGAVLDIVVERGWVSAEEVAALRAGHGVPAPMATETVSEPESEGAPAAAATPTPVAVPRPVPVPAPNAAPLADADPEPTPEPPPDLAATVTSPQPVAIPHRVAIRLTNGELVAVGEADDEERAQAIGQAIISELASATRDEWPFFGGRYLRPETIVSVDVIAAETEVTA